MKWVVLGEWFVCRNAREDLREVQLLGETYECKLSSREFIRSENVRIVGVTVLDSVEESLHSCDDSSENMERRESGPE